MNKLPPVGRTDMYNFVAFVGLYLFHICIILRYSFKDVRLLFAEINDKRFMSLCLCL
jgi:hypothetical protein